MSHAFNPYPAVAMAKLLLLGVIVSGAIYLLRDALGDFLIQAFAICWLAALFFILVAFIRSKFYSIELDDQVITYKGGVLSTRKIIIPYARVTEASFTQTIIQRIFGVGNLNISTAGGGNVAIRMNDVKHSDLVAILGDINTKTGKDSGI